MSFPGRRGPCRHLHQIKFKNYGSPMNTDANKQDTGREHAGKIGERDIAFDSQTILQTILDHLPSAVTLFGSDMGMIAYNQKLKTLLDFPEELFVNGLPSLTALIHFNAARGEYGPGNPKEIAAAAIERTKKRQPHVFERRRPDGKVLEVRGTPLPNGGFLTIYTDVTERREAEEAVRLAKERVEQAIDHSSAYIWEIDAEGQILFMQGVKKVLGFEPEEIHGRRMADLMALDTQEDRADTKLFRAMAANQPFQEIDVHYLGKGGESIWVSSSGYPIYDGELRFHGYRGVDVNVTELTKAKKEVERLALSDPLTGLANRRHLVEQYSREVSRAKRSGKPISLLILDLDHFKSVNDRYGHLAGDACLKCVTAVIESYLRNIDIAARFGGEEFIVLLPETGESGARIVAEKLRAAVAETEIQLHEELLHVTVSIGIATAKPSELENFDEIVGKADTAMYRAKESGRNMVCVNTDIA
jgi:diguanylate cyclase (GGDEF)-like protein/PAS domain S-box-containing protein